MKKLVVFDVDGTILDSFGLFERLAEQYSAEQGLPRPCMTSIKRGYAYPDNYDFGWGVTKEEQRRHLHEIFRRGDHYTAHGDVEWVPHLFDGVEDALRHMKGQGYTLALITSKAEDPLLRLLKHHDVGSLFSSIRTSTDVKRRGEKEKPEPDQLLSVMKELGFHAQETVMIGDTTMDIHMGRGALTHTIGVTWGTHPRDYLEKAGAHIILDQHFGEVAPTVRKIFG